MSKPTIVTAYYVLKAKHSHEKYRIWIKNKLENIETPMVLFCERESFDMLREFRKHHLEYTHFVIKPFNELLMSQLKEDWETQWHLDKEKNIHHPDLYIVWNEKMNFIKESATINPFDSEWFIWSDIGGFKKPAIMKYFKNWPSIKLINEKLPKYKLSCLQVNSDFNLKNYTVDEKNILKEDLPDTHTGAGYLILHREQINEIHNNYYDLLNKYIKNHKFAGKEQNLYTNFCVAYPDLANPIKLPNFLKKASLIIKGKLVNLDMWFYMQDYLNQFNSVSFKLRIQSLRKELRELRELRELLWPLRRMLRENWHTYKNKLRKKQ